MKGRKQLIDSDVLEMEKKYAKNDYQVLMKKYELIQKELKLQKEKELALKNELSEYRKLMFKSAQKDLHQILQLQHQKIVQLQISNQLLQSKYDKILMNSTSSSETQYAIKCKQLQKRLKENEISHHKEISTLKAKMVKMNASQLMDRETTPNTISPISRVKKFV